MKNQFVNLLFIVVFVLNMSAQETEKDTIFDKNSKTFMVLPLIINNPAMKTGFGVMPMYFFKFNKEDIFSPPSTVSIYELYTTNNSYVFVPSAKLFWNEDKNRVNVYVGTMRVNNDFDYEIEDEDLHLVFSEFRSFISMEYSKKIIGNFYLGGLYIGTKTKYKFDQGSDEENEFTKIFFEEHGSQVVELE